MTTAARCRVCGSAAVAPRRLEEMMFGSREQFDYYECSACGSLSIGEVPADLGRHYPPTYYSFATARNRSRFGRLVRRVAISVLLNMPAPLSDLLPATMSGWRGMRKASVKRSTRILDVGCGNGALLRALERFGFKDLNGVDPFTERPGRWPHITITKGELRDLDGTYDFFFVSHSLEHMPDPLAALREVARICAPGGHVLISLPVVNRSWAELGPDWIGLDPPRHLFIPSVSGLAALIGSVPGLRVKETWFDTSAMEFYGSALARLRVPTSDRATGVATDPAQYFDRSQLERWSRQAREYNKRGEAGTASFLIERI
jgi:SAM-dependent methyltransferase